MNSQSLWAGHDYAWIPNRGKGMTFSYSVIRVKVQKVSKHRLYGNQNATTLVTFEVLDWDGIPNPSTDIRSGIPAREIIDFWDSYYNEHEERLNARKEQRAQEAAAARKKQMENHAIATALVERGFDKEDFNMDYSSTTYVRIDRKALMKFLGVHVETLESKNDYR